MGWAYSVDLRERVVAAFDRTDMTEEQVAAFFKVGEATVRRWKRLKRETGSLERKPGGGGNPPRVEPRQYAVVRAIVAEKADLTDQEIGAGRAADPGAAAQVHRAREDARPEPSRLHRRGGQPHRNDARLRASAAR